MAITGFALLPCFLAVAGFCVVCAAVGVLLACGGCVALVAAFFRLHGSCGFNVAGFGVVALPGLQPLVMAGCRWYKLFCRWAMKGLT